MKLLRPNGWVQLGTSPEGRSEAEPLRRKGGGPNFSEEGVLGTTFKKVSVQTIPGIPGNTSEKGKKGVLEQCSAPVYLLASKQGLRHKTVVEPLLPTDKDNTA